MMTARSLFSPAEITKVQPIKVNRPVTKTELGRLRQWPFYLDVVSAIRDILSPTNWVTLNYLAQRLSEAARLAWSVVSGGIRGLQGTGMGDDCNSTSPR